MDVIIRVAGVIGAPGSVGDDGPATLAQLNDPFGVAVTADGGFLIADIVNHVVRKVAADGVITRVAGSTGAAGSAGDGGPATSAQLNRPAGVAATSDGGFLIADTNNQVIRKVSADGVITRVAGMIGAGGSAGDGGPATSAQLNGPFGVAVTADGGFLIADTDNQVIRKVSADGIITRVAGTAGVVGTGGDGGPATSAQLNYPLALAVTADGGFLIPDQNNHVVRKVSAAGVISRVAGITGAAGSAGDDGPATGAQLNCPAAVAVTADGGFLFTDNKNHVVRKVSADGTITRVAGTLGAAGSAGDDGPATVAQLHYPYGLAATAHGGFLIADNYNQVVRKVEPAA